MGNEVSSIKIDFPKLFSTFINKVDLFSDKDATPTSVTESPEEDPKDETLLRNKKLLDDLTSIMTTLGANTQDEKLLQSEKLLDDLKSVLEPASRYLPGIYHRNYFDRLIKTLPSVQKLFPGTMQTLAGAIYDHLNPQFKDYLKGFLGLTSNVYRSFLEPENLQLTNFPKPTSMLPALATFRPLSQSDITNFFFAPFTLPTDEVERLCGAKVAVVSLPSSYRKHPVLCWGSVAHEAGGHDVLHSYPGLLAELKRNVRQLFYQGPDPHLGKLESESQFLGLLWQAWTEETAADVYAVMNLGPSYGFALVTYLAALSERIRTERTQMVRDELPALSISSRNSLSFDYHPTALLAIYAVLGAIEALVSLSEGNKKTYLNAIKDCIGVCLEANNKLVKGASELPDFIKQLFAHYKTDSVRIHGTVRLKTGRWIRIEPDEFPIPLHEMQEHARRVGYYIATAELQALGRHSIQDLETWDDTDESAAQKVAAQINQGFENIIDMGDDAVLFAGAMQALGADPGKYDVINENLGKALGASFNDDPIWGKPTWHPIAEVPEPLRGKEEVA